MHQILCLKRLLCFWLQWFRVILSSGPKWMCLASGSFYLTQLKVAGDWEWLFLADTTECVWWLRVALSSWHNWNWLVTESDSFWRTQLNVSGDWKWLFLTDTTECVWWLRMALSGGHNWMCLVTESGFLADITECVWWLRVSLSGGHNWKWLVIENGSFWRTRLNVSGD
jgi:hypothetical protein